MVTFVEPRLEYVSPKLTREALKGRAPFEPGVKELHLPFLALVETCAAINRRTRRASYALAIGAKTSLEDWAEDGKVIFYPLDDMQAQQALNVALRDRLSGSDSTYATLSEQGGITWKSFDNEHLTRYQGRVSP